MGVGKYFALLAASAGVTFGGVVGLVDGAIDGDKISNERNNLNNQYHQVVAQIKLNDEYQDFYAASYRDAYESYKNGNLSANELNKMLTEMTDGSFFDDNKDKFATDEQLDIIEGIEDAKKDLEEQNKKNTNKAIASAFGFSGGLFGALLASKGIQEDIRDDQEKEM